ncbi:MAG: ParM/StbA family protein [Defluviitaleaceae bacterium]|nr:ParM/StbA family protein [Defluviitaleaceae bacterium]
MSNHIVIAVDHGNRNMKTMNHVFPASYVETGHLPTFGADTLTYQGKEYTLTDQRMPQLNEKYVDDRYFILTLFAIGKELAERVMDYAGESIEVVLLTGLPPLHVKEMGARFESYFKRNGEPVSFRFNQMPFTIKIADVYVYPQSYSAILTVSDQVNDVRVLNVVDIGGFTVDLLQLTDLRPDMSVCTSLYEGVCTLFNRVNEQIRAAGKKNIPDTIIESVLLNDERVLRDSSEDRVALIRMEAERFTRELLFAVSQTGLDLTENKTVFVGGGSLLLRECIERSGMVAKPLFIPDVHANANGYRVIYDRR